LGYYYQTGFAAYKTACLAEAACDWLSWNGYDGMLFVVNFKQNLPTATVPAAGFYAICFPNPVSNQGGNTLVLAAGLFSSWLP
jgi:hypothetical protein